MNIEYQVAQLRATLADLEKRTRAGQTRLLQLREEAAQAEQALSYNAGRLRQIRETLSALAPPQVSGLRFPARPARRSRRK